MADVLFVVACIAIFVGLVWVPGYQAYERGRWIWLVLIIVGAPLAGVFWILTQKALDRAGMNTPKITL